MQSFWWFFLVIVFSLGIGLSLEGCRGGSRASLLSLSHLYPSIKFTHGENQETLLEGFTIRNGQGGFEGGESTGIAEQPLSPVHQPYGKMLLPKTVHDIMAEENHDLFWFCSH